jgi:hypothetical protein
MTIQNLENVCVMLASKVGTVHRYLLVKNGKEKKLMEPVYATGVGRELTVLKLPVMLIIVMAKDRVLLFRKMTTPFLENVIV